MLTQLRAVGLTALVSAGCGTAPPRDQPAPDTTAPAMAPIPSIQPAAAPPASTPTVTSVGAQWNYSHDEDEMTGKVQHAATVISDNTVEFGFPYQGTQHGYLTVRKHPRHGNDVIFRIERGQLLCPSWDGCSVLVRFDAAAPSSFSANPPADQSSETIFIENYARFMSKLRGAKSVRISPKVFQQGSVVFTFDVSGFDAAKFRGE